MNLDEASAVITGLLAELPPDDHLRLLQDLLARVPAGRGRSVLLTLQPNLDVRLAAALMQAIDEAATSNGWTDICFEGTGLRITGVAPALRTEPPALEENPPPGVDLAEARGRREALAVARAVLATELRGAPHNAPGRTQLTYVGGLARARRLIEGLYREAVTAEEDIILTPPPEPSP